MGDESEQRQNASSSAQQPESGKAAARKAAHSVTVAKSAAKPAAKRGTKPPTKKTPARKTSAKVRATAEPPFNPLNPRMLERQMAEVTRQLQEQDFATEEEANAFLQQLVAQGGPPIRPPTTPLEEAQDLVYQAMEAKGKRQEALARQALAISPDCADAYALLAESSSDLTKARQFYEEGVRAGERAMGAEMFEQGAGEFWGFIESRPYMRAREGLGHVLWGLDEREAASP